MEIITKRTKCPDEVIPAGESQSSVKDEVNRRTHKAGYTDRDGQPKISRQTGNGKGDTCRPMNKKLYDENYDRIFKKE